WIKRTVIGQSFPAELNNQPGSFFRVIFLQKEKITVFNIKVRHLPLVNAVGIDYNQAFPGLPENMAKPETGNAAGTDQVTENISRTNRREL
ncbi:hypothetical protein Q6325_27360, partial [Klebsiella pneumoniae]|uniref:hypothetical protein n=1 Tax=Klebsiella pneumoniae TaxID=573 RepID=UPI002731D805